MFVKDSSSDSNQSEDIHPAPYNKRHRKTGEEYQLELAILTHTLDDMKMLFETRRVNQELYCNILKLSHINFHSEAMQNSYLETLLTTIPPKHRLPIEINFMQKILQKWSVAELISKKGRNHAFDHACQHFQLREYLKGDVIFWEGDKPDGYYFILDGSVNIFGRKDYNLLTKQIYEERRKFQFLTQKERKHTLFSHILRLKRQRALIKLNFIHIFSSITQVRKLVTKIKLGRRLLNRIKRLKNNDTNQQTQGNLDYEFQFSTLTGGIKLCFFRKLDSFFRDGVMIQKFILSLPKNNGFGDLGIITGNPRSRTIVASANVKVLFLPAEDYSLIFKERGIINVQLELKKLNEKIQFFQSNFFHGIPAGLVIKLQYNFVKKSYDINQHIYREGEEANEVYIIKRGIVEIIGQQGFRISQMGDGSIFGEIEILNKMKNRLLTAICRTDRAKVYSINKGLFQKLLDDNKHFRQIIKEKCKRRIDWEVKRQVEDQNNYIQNKELTKKFSEEILAQLAERNQLDRVIDSPKYFEKETLTQMIRKNTSPQNTIQKEVEIMSKALKQIDKYSSEIKQLSRKQHLSSRKKTVPDTQDQNRWRACNSPLGKPHTLREYQLFRQGKSPRGQILTNTSQKHTSTSRSIQMSQIHKSIQLKSYSPTLNIPSTDSINTIMNSPKTRRPYLTSLQKIGSPVNSLFHKENRERQESIQMI